MSGYLNWFGSTWFATTGELVPLGTCGFPALGFRNAGEVDARRNVAAISLGESKSESNKLLVSLSTSCRLLGAKRTADPSQLYSIILELD